MNHRLVSDLQRVRSDGILDISVPLGPDLMLWPGNPPFRLDPIKRLSEGADADLSELRVSTHAGTHLDTPGHVLPGARTSESLRLEQLVGPVFVVDLARVRASITATHLASKVQAGTTRVLLKTRNSLLWRDDRSTFPASYVALSESGAWWLVRHGVDFVGIDFLSIEARGVPGRPVHRILVEAGAAILEGVDLSRVASGWYFLICLPLRVVGADGALARAVLLPLDEPAG